MFGYLPDKEPVGFEIAIFKWVFLPVMALGAFAVFSDISEGRSKCEAICMERGFHGFRYTPSGRYGIGGNNCYCLTEEESNMKKRIPKGTQVF
ncbi:hypothetical protein PVT68_08555 [Microbulbifer bruguierae]|uniref:Uncharacterized protein n=1 Tax=Microbulbifer bruguierae TaxID=3029061 RepID=A0ABY8NHC8_9GAMM|nr:hypothetical protein [Microbulbifer bruguierae]WGL18331.1 hypothetical protein PVT68_08555 [Microbulbifer bruguierae]